MLTAPRIRNFSNLKEHTSPGNRWFLSAEIEVKFSFFGPWEKITVARRSGVDYPNISEVYTWHSVDPPLLFSREVAEYIYFLEQVYREKEVMNAAS